MFIADQAIGIDDMAYIADDDVKQLIPKIGHRAKFTAAVKRLQV